MKAYQQIINDRRIQVIDYPGKKGTIVAIHGIAATHKSLQYFIDVLAGDYRVVTLDIPGRGKSEAPLAPSSIFRQAETLIKLIKELQIEEPILLGHSMGAYIAALIASQLEDAKALILLDGAAEMSERQAEILEPLLSRLGQRYSSKEAYVEELKTIFSYMDIPWDETLQALAEYEVIEEDGTWRQSIDIDTLRADGESLYHFDPEKVMGRVKCPVLLVHAEGPVGDDPLFYLDDFALIREHTHNLEIFSAGCNHYTMILEECEDLNSTILSFLNRIEEEELS